MGIINTHDDFEHPEGKIQLLEGTVLDCYPLEQVGEQVDNKVKLDTTGTYFSIGKRRLAPAPITDETNEAPCLHGDKRIPSSNLRCLP